MAKPADEEDGWEWNRKEDESRFMTARSGDHLMCPFQCDLCVFRNIYQRDPWENDVADRKMIVFIRRMNLDAFWGREASTVKANAGVLRKGLKICVDAKMTPRCRRLIYLWDLSRCKTSWATLLKKSSISC